MKKSRYAIGMIVGIFATLVGLFNLLRPGGNVASGLFTGLGGLVILIGTYVVDRKARAPGRPGYEPRE